MRQEDEDGQETGTERNAAESSRRTKTDRKPGESSRKTELTGMRQDAATEQNRQEIGKNGKK